MRRFAGITRLLVLGGLSVVAVFFSTGCLPDTAEFNHGTLPNILGVEIFHVCVPNSGGGGYTNYTVAVGPGGSATTTGTEETPFLDDCDYSVGDESQVDPSAVQASQPGQY